VPPKYVEYVNADRAAFSLLIKGVATIAINGLKGAWRSRKVVRTGEACNIRTTLIIERQAICELSGASAHDYWARGGPILDCSPLELLHLALSLSRFALLTIDCSQSEMGLRGQRGLLFKFGHFEPGFFGRLRVVARAVLDGKKNPSKKRKKPTEWRGPGNLGELTMNTEVYRITNPKSGSPRQCSGSSNLEIDK
jgi:hypothetical protein